MSKQVCGRELRGGMEEERWGNRERKSVVVRRVREGECVIIYLYNNIFIFIYIYICNVM
jgi:hypothetical protein